MKKHPYNDDDDDDDDGSVEKQAKDITDCQFKVCCDYALKMEVSKTKLYFIMMTMTMIRMMVVRPVMLMTLMMLMMTTMTR